jgi:K+-transporting ATPase ATPase C chain
MVSRQTWAAVRLLIVLVVLTGISYPLAVWVVSRTPGLENKAEGSIVSDHGHAVGSSLIGINLVGNQYFYARPSAQASDYSATDPTKLGLAGTDPSSSAASNLSQDSTTLAAQIAARKALIARREGVSPDQVPADAVTASASGLDPDISPAYAYLQAARVARINHLAVPRVDQIIADNVRGRALGVLGDPAVNVQALNLAVAQAIQAADG